VNHAPAKAMVAISAISAGRETCSTLHVSAPYAAT
jgi:hypothetical protein